MGAMPHQQPLSLVHTSTPSTRARDNGTLTRSERAELTQELIRAAHECADPQRRKALLDEVVVLNRSVAEAVASRYRGRGVAQEDLEQSAFEGLVKAVHKFDPTVRPDLLTYAVPTIRGEVQRWFRDQSWMVRPPRRIQETQWKVSRSIARLSQELGREPTDEELRADIGCSAADVSEAVQGFGCFQPPSLDRPVAGPDGPTLGDVVHEGEEDGYAAAEARAALGPVVRQLPERDRQILYMRFFEEQSQQEIGDSLGVTQMQVSRLLQRIMRDLRRQLTDGALGRAAAS
jgi:RNA polymerase sigma-B factor